MSHSANPGLQIPILTSILVKGEEVCTNRRRRISPEAGRALEILGHAIDYLTDEFFHESGPAPLQKAQLEAVQLLMHRNRQIYFACPEIPTFGERMRALLRRW